MSIALARKYRPRTFADVAVQSHVAATLQGAIARGRVAHGYLLCGPRGVGKTTLARVLAMALNCERRESSSDQLRGASAEAEDRSASNETRAREASEAEGRSASNETTGFTGAAGEPCGTCPSCQRIWSGSTSLDVVEIDAASNRGVDDARELRERAMYAPSGDDRYKVYIVDEAHMLTREAWNALLKVLEEPPPRVVFVFATTEPQKIAQAAAPVLSRLQRFDFRRIGAGEIRARLQRVLGDEGVQADADALAMLSRAADGSMRDALSLTDQVLAAGDGRVTAARVREALGLVPEDEYLAVLDLVADRRAGDVFALVGRLADAGVDFGGFLAGLGDMLRAQLAVVLGGTAAEVSERAREQLAAGKDRFAPGDLLRMLQLLAELEPRFRKSSQQQLLVEMLLVRFALLDRAVALEDVLRSLGGGGGGGGGEVPSGRGERDRAPQRAAPAPVEREFRAGAADADTARTPRVPADFRAPDEPPPYDDAPHPADLVDDAPRRPSARSASAPVAPPAAPSRPEPAPRQRPAPAPAGRVPDLNAVAAAWDDLVAAARAAGKSLLATALEHASPVAVTGQGVLAIELDEPNDFFAQAVESGRGDILTILRDRLGALQRVELRGGAAAPGGPTKRISDEDIRSERLAALRKYDPVLGAAIDALDLDVMD